ncbi:MAG: NusA antitermination factor, partial [Microgenomates group bacterium GW2011_GWC1_39_12]
GNEIIVSRSHKGLVEGLFHREVPEVAQGAVELRIVVREAGGRTKIAVFSKQSGVDPVGSCVGQKGVRVTAVINELGGNEKVDIIQWSDQPKAFITAALAPAKDIDVALNEEEKEATVTVPEDQLSLAIGRDGQNVRLAAKLTGWKIDIQGKPVVGKEEVSTDKPKEEIQVSPDQPIVEVKEPEKQEVVKEEKVEPVQEASVEVVVETPKTETVQADTTPSV